MKFSQLEVEVLKMWKDGYEPKQIAKALNCSRSAVYKAIWKWRRYNRLKEDSWFRVLFETLFEIHKMATESSLKYMGSEHEPIYVKIRDLSEKGMRVLNTAFKYYRLEGEKL